MKSDRWADRLNDLEDELFARGAQIVIDPNLDDDRKLAILEGILAFENARHDAIDDGFGKPIHDC